VDAYNVAATLFSSGIGAHDADKLRSDNIVVRRSVEGDVITPLFSDRAKRIQQGDLVDDDDGTPMAWLGRKDVDSDAYRVDDTTQRVVFVLLGRHDTPGEMLLEVADMISTNLRPGFPRMKATATLSS